MIPKIEENSVNVNYFLGIIWGKNGTLWAVGEGFFSSSLFSFFFIFLLFLFLSFERRKDMGTLSLPFLFVFGRRFSGPLLSYYTPSPLFISWRITMQKQDKSLGADFRLQTQAEVVDLKF